MFDHIIFNFSSWLFRWQETLFRLTKEWNISGNSLNITIIYDGLRSMDQPVYETNSNSCLDRKKYEITTTKNLNLSKIKLRKFSRCLLNNFLSVTDVPVISFELGARGGVGIPGSVRTRQLIRLLWTVPFISSIETVTW